MEECIKRFTEEEKQTINARLCFLSIQYESVFNVIAQKYGTSNEYVKNVFLDVMCNKEENIYSFWDFLDNCLPLLRGYEE